MIVRFSVRGHRDQATGCAAQTRAFATACIALAIVLPVSRLLVIALSSVVTKSNLEYLSTILTFSDDAPSK